MRSYILDLKRRVAERIAAGESAEKMIATLAPQVRAEHPDWAPEWIDFAIRYFVDKG